MKNPSLVAYKAIVQEFMRHFTSIECKMINQNENMLADSLASLAIVLKKEKMTLQVEKQPDLIKGGLCLPEDW